MRSIWLRKKRIAAGGKETMTTPAASTGSRQKNNGRTNWMRRRRMGATLWRETRLAVSRRRTRRCAAWPFIRVYDIVPL